MTIPQVLTLVTYGPQRSPADGIVASAGASGRPKRHSALMRVLKRLDGLPWEKMVIALALSAIAAWTFGWIAGTIVTFLAGR